MITVRVRKSWLSDEGFGFLVKSVGNILLLGAAFAPHAARDLWPGEAPALVEFASNLFLELGLILPILVVVLWLMVDWRDIFPAKRDVDRADARRTEIALAERAELLNLLRESRYQDAGLHLASRSTPMTRREVKIAPEDGAYRDAQNLPHPNDLPCDDPWINRLHEEWRSGTFRTTPSWEREYMSVREEHYRTLLRSVRAGRFEGACGCRECTFRRALDSA